MPKCKDFHRTSGNFNWDSIRCTSIIKVNKSRNRTTKLVSFHPKDKWKRAEFMKSLVRIRSLNMICSTINTVKFKIQKRICKKMISTVISKINRALSRRINRNKIKALFTMVIKLEFTLQKAKIIKINSIIWSRN
jgi:hypothetical protein